jgi:hypothetical protein
VPGQKKRGSPCDRDPRASLEHAISLARAALQADSNPEKTAPVLEKSADILPDTGEQQ